MTERDRTTPGLGTIISLGAGGGERAAGLRETGAQKIIMLEAYAATARALALDAAGRPGLEVIHAAAGPAEGEGELQCWNLARLNSLHDPTPLLRDCFPGLRLRDRQPVRIITPDQIVARTGGILRPARLILDFPGSERAVLQAWQAAGLLAQIDQIELHVPEAMMYAGAGCRAELEEWLAAEGFSVTSRNTEDSEWTVLDLCADHTARNLARARAQVTELTAALADRDRALKAAEDRAAERDAAMTEQVAEALAEALAEAKAAAEAHAATLAERDRALKAAEDRAAERDAAVTAAVAGALAEAKAAAEAHAATLAERDRALKAAEDRAAKLDAAMAEQVAEAKAAAEAREKSLAVLRDRNAQLTDDVQRGLFDHRKLAQDLSFALRVQDRLDSDLRDLQGRYAQLLTVRQQQDDLLRQLTPRLQRAAAELQTLTTGTPVTARISQPVTDPAAAGPKPKRAKQPKRKGQ